MSDSINRLTQNSGQETSAPTHDVPGPRRNSFLVFVSWMAILLCIAFLSGTVLVSQFVAPRGMEMSRSEFLLVNFFAKSLMGSPWTEQQKISQIEQFAKGPLDQRYSHAILLNEIVGPQRAIEQLTKIDKAVAARVENGAETDSDTFPIESHSELRRIIGDLFDQYAAGNFDTSTVASEDRDLLEDQLGFVGNLVLHPKASTDENARNAIDEEVARVFSVEVLLMTVGFFVFLAALAASGTLYAIWHWRESYSRFVHQSQRGFLYLETFAIWLVMFIGMQIFVGVVFGKLRIESWLLLISPVLFFGSLVALAWPIVRGISFQTLCKDIGWDFHNPIKELLAGGFCYLALIIPIFLGLITTSLLEYQATQWFPPGEFESRTTVSHPIEEEIASGDPVVWMMMIVATCVAAPIVEETMFRGVLYRYLRDSTGKLFATMTSIVLSAIGNGLLFAAIHPQGIIGIPLLTMLAVGFSLAREWRGSLIAPMVMHAIHNGIVTTFAITTMG